MDDMNQLASAGLTLVFTAILLIAGQLYMGTKTPSHTYSITALSSSAAATERAVR